MNPNHLNDSKSLWRGAGETALFVAFAGAVGSMNVPFNGDFTGGEDFEKEISFSSIPETGDARLKRIINLMRKSKEGEKFYQYAAMNGLTFRWTKEKENAGIYSNGHVEISANKTDKEIALTLVHEIAHGIQDHMLKIYEWRQDPLTAWQTRRAEEVHACALTAHFAAAYKDETGTDLTSNVDDYAYGDITAYTYSIVPESRRDFFEDAIMPCLDEINLYPDYEKRHLKSSKLFYELKKATFNLAIEMHKAGNSVEPYVTHLSSVSDSEKEKMFRSLFTPIAVGDQHVIDPKAQNIDEHVPEFLVFLESSESRAIEDVRMMQVLASRYERRLSEILSASDHDPVLVKFGSFPRPK